MAGNGNGHKPDPPQKIDGTGIYSKEGKKLDYALVINGETDKEKKRDKLQKMSPVRELIPRSGALGTRYRPDSR